MAILTSWPGLCVCVCVCTSLRWFYFWTKSVNATRHVSTDRQPQPRNVDGRVPQVVGESVIAPSRWNCFRRRLCWSLPGISSLHCLCVNGPFACVLVGCLVTQRVGQLSPKTETKLPVASSLAAHTVLFAWWSLVYSLYIASSSYLISIVLQLLQMLTPTNEAEVWS